METEENIEAVASQASGPPPDLSDYSDYRDYLRERLAFEKERNPRLSLHFFARKMKVSTPFLSMLFSKKKHMSLLSLVAVSDYLKLERKDRMLIVFALLENTAKSEEQKSFFAIMCSQLRAFKLINHQLPEHDMSEYKGYVSSELGMILSGLAQLSTFKDDLDWVMSQIIVPDLSRQDVAEALRKVQVAHKALGTDPNVSTIEATVISAPASESLYRPAWSLHDKALSHGDKIRPSASCSMTITVNEQGYRELFAAFGDFATRVQEIAERCSFTDRVFVLNTGLFCVAKPPQAPVAKSPNEGTTANPDSVVAKL
jgi:uncharacterized protein (TIGR02147 family)